MSNWITGLAMLRGFVRSTKSRSKLLLAKLGERLRNLGFPDSERTEGADRVEASNLLKETIHFFVNFDFQFSRDVSRPTFQS
jgi:hypothetical protein